MLLYYETFVSYIDRYDFPTTIQFTLATSGKWLKLDLLKQSLYQLQNRCLNDLQKKSHTLKHRSLLNLFDSLLKATKIDDWKYVKGEKKIPS